MPLFTYKQFNVLFHIVCVLITTGIVIWWIHKYSLENLSSSIDFKGYFKTDDDVQPAFSICVDDPKLNEKLELSAPGYNKSTYLNFLKGKVYHEELRNLDFNHVRFNWSAYFYQTPKAYIVAKDGAKLGRVPMSKYWRYYTSFIGLRSGNKALTNCLAVEPLSSSVTNIRLRFNGSIFKNGKRRNYELRVLLHYKRQIIRSYPTTKYLWDPRDNVTAYRMEFRVQDVEVLHRYNGRHHLCIEDWRNYDKLALETHLNEVGCRSPYHVSETNRSVCSSKEKMKESLFPISAIFMKKFDTPCRSIEKVYYTYQEAVTKSIPDGTFEIKFHFNSRYKEIVQYQQIDFWVNLEYTI